MSAVGEMSERKERPAYVRFERKAEEDVAASRAAGHYVGKDVDYALITPAYSKDVFITEVQQWKLNMKQEVANGRLNPAWMDGYLKAYDAWQNGQEIPLSGTPIKGWGVISPGQQETLIRMNCLTVEDLAAMTDEGIKRVGMGAMELKNKASAWLSQLNDKGPLTQEMAALKTENAQLKSSVDTLTRQVGELMAQARATINTPQQIAAVAEEIQAADIMPEDSPPVRVARKATGDSATL